MSISIPIPIQSLSSVKALSGCPVGGQSEALTATQSHLLLTSRGTIPFKATPIQMGGGPRTYPGGLSKWQWKRMQAKKAKQLLKARLSRERQIYEMRKRAELKAAISELERPWEVVEKPPNLFSVSADEQLKVLADRFQKPGGFDLWSEKDGPELFRPDNGLPSMRFFPKGVVHSVKPYGKLEETSTSKIDEFESSGLKYDSVPGPTTGSVGNMCLRRNMGYKNSRGSGNSTDKGENVSDFNSTGLKSGGNKGLNGNIKGKVRTGDTRRKYLSDSRERNSRNAGFHVRNDERKYLSDSKNAGFQNRSGGRIVRRSDNDVEYGRSNSYGKGEKMNSQVFDMSLQGDGDYGFDWED